MEKKDFLSSFWFRSLAAPSNMSARQGSSIYPETEEVTNKKLWLTRKKVTHTFSLDLHQESFVNQSSHSVVFSSVQTGWTTNKPTSQEVNFTFVFVRVEVRPLRVPFQVHPDGKTANKGDTRCRCSKSSRTWHEREIRQTNPDPQIPKFGITSFGDPSARTGKCFGADPANANNSNSTQCSNSSRSRDCAICSGWMSWEILRWEDESLLLWRISDILESKRREENKEPFGWVWARIKQISKIKFSQKCKMTWRQLKRHTLW